MLSKVLSDSFRGISDLKVSLFQEKENTDFFLFYVTIFCENADLLHEEVMLYFLRMFYFLYIMIIIIMNHDTNYY